MLRSCRTIAMTLCSAAALMSFAWPARGAEPLRVYGLNPRYLAVNGVPFVGVGVSDAGLRFDAGAPYGPHFAALKSAGLNMVTIQLGGGIGPASWSPFARRGARYDLSRLNGAYFDRLAAACRQAATRGIAVRLVLFDLEAARRPALWKQSAFCRANNVNGVDGDPGHTGRGDDPKRGLFSGANAGALRYQQAYVRQVATVAARAGNAMLDLGVSTGTADTWSARLTRAISSVGVVALVAPRDAADWSEEHWSTTALEGTIAQDMPVARPILYVGSDPKAGTEAQRRKAVWTAVTCGTNVLVPGAAGRRTADTAWLKQLGTLARAARMAAVWDAVPAPRRLLTGNATAVASRKTLLAYMPRGGELGVDLFGLPRFIDVLWLNPRTGATTLAQLRTRGDVGRYTVTTPDDGDWALIVHPSPGHDDAAPPVHEDSPFTPH